MTPAERAVIDAAKALVANLDDMGATRDLIDAVSMLDVEDSGPATFTDADGTVWIRRANGRYSANYTHGIHTLDAIREVYGEQK